MTNVRETQSEIINRLRRDLHQPHPTRFNLHPRARLIIGVVAYLIFAACVIFWPHKSEAAELPGPRIINEMSSEPGESKMDFLKRVAVFMRGWTFYNGGNEACGAITRDGKMWHVVVTTLDSQIECESKLAVAYSKPTGETIHSHPKADANGKIVLSEQTRQRAGAALGGRLEVSPLPRTFSPGDYDAGPGYLVADDVLMYQRGKGSARIVWELPGFVDESQ